MTTTFPSEGATAVGRERGDGWLLTLAMALAAFAIGRALAVNAWSYDPRSMTWLTVAAVMAVLGVRFVRFPPLERWLGNVGGGPVCLLIVAALLVQVWPLIRLRNTPAGWTASLVVITVLAIAGALRPGRLATLHALALVALFSVIGVMALHLGPKPRIDVYAFQERGSEVLLHGKDPYDPAQVRFPNVYQPDDQFYGPGVVAPDETLTYGFPYPPLSLLMVVPGHLLGDVRYIDVLAVAISALLMALARPGRLGVMAAALLLLTSQGFLVLAMSWTEPLVILTFSLTVFCACRFRKALPYALGLFLASKQYSILAIPAVWLLLEEPNRGKGFARTILIAVVVAAVVTLPLMLWNLREFLRAVAFWQLVQPFRPDAMSYLVWFYNHTGRRPPIWTPLAAAAAAVVLALRRAPRTAAGFAAAVTLIYLTFFLFNKQAFCNYYYFTIATACWAVAAVQPRFLAAAPAPNVAVVAQTSGNS